MGPVDSFGSTARKLSRNPLGIISLFIVLLYGIASLVLGSSSGSFEPPGRLILIGFLALFPFVVLGVFGWLVSRHHEKLYGPGDYESDDAFLNTLSPEIQRQRLDEEVFEMTGGEADASTQEEREVPEETGPAEKGEQESSRLSESDLAKYRSEAVLAEDLVMRQLEAEYETAIRRQTAIGKGNSQIRFDGLFIRSEEIVAIEVKVFRGDSFTKNLSNRSRQIAGTAARLKSLSGDKNASIIIAIVTVNVDSRSEKNIREGIIEAIEGVDIPFEVRSYDLNDLRGQFGLSA